MSEKPCEKCDQWEDEYSRQKCYVREVQAGMTADTCGLLAHGMGHQEGYAVGESERDALRAEVEKYKRALEWVLRKTVDSMDCPMDCPPELHGKECDGPSNRECVKCVSKWALSEAGK